MVAEQIDPLLSIMLTLLFALALSSNSAWAQASAGFRPAVPKTWDEDALKEWMTPLAGLNQRPAHITSTAYYAMPIDNLRTYPVYVEGREPAGYWEFLQKVGPQPLIEPEKLKSENDWIEAGRVVFEQMDHIHLRTYDPELIALGRRGHSALLKPDGTAANLRWVPTQHGVALSFPNCSNCHVLHKRDGTRIPGAPSFGGDLAFIGPPGPSAISIVQSAKHFVNGGAPIRMGDEPFGMWLFRAFGVPWRQDENNSRLKAMTAAEFARWVAAGLKGAAPNRWNGSPFYPAKTPDLIGIKDRRYIDHTGTHLNRGIGDIMRYAAMVSWAETTEFGDHQMLGGGAERPKARRSDEMLYALALYIQSLQPPANPHPFDANAKAGEKVFQRSGCGTCHVPPLYTNNKLTLAQGFIPPANVLPTIDVLPVSVGTDPGLALRTRKGTGFYKVPSLKGLWYRARYLHDGSVASLEEMFDPSRLTDTHKPGGFAPPNSLTQAIPGHEFGLKLSGGERRQLIAFLRTL